MCSVPDLGSQYPRDLCIWRWFHQKLRKDNLRVGSPGAETHGLTLLYTWMSFKAMSTNENSCTPLFPHQIVHRWLKRMRLVLETSPFYAFSCNFYLIKIIIVIIYISRFATGIRNGRASWNFWLEFLSSIFTKNLRQGLPLLSLISCP